MARLAGKNVMVVGNGDTIPGVTGAIQISHDGGRSWRRAPLPVEPNSVIYRFATHPELPNVIVAASLTGTSMSARTRAGRGRSASGSLARSAPWR